MFDIADVFDVKPAVIDGAPISPAFRVKVRGARARGRRRLYAEFLIDFYVMPGCHLTHSAWIGGKKIESFIKRGAWILLIRAYIESAGVPA